MNARMTPVMIDGEILTLDCELLDILPGAMDVYI